jgi:hypothetical protein
MLSPIAYRQSPLRFGKDEASTSPGEHTTPKPTPRVVEGDVVVSLKKVPTDDATDADAPEIEYELPTLNEGDYLTLAVIGKDDHPNYVASATRINDHVEANFKHMSANARSISDTMKAIMDVVLAKLKATVSKPTND